jgi:BirA family biotin operon repressor/biotin-[acetyl-CoA-carboxylase] ligase
LHWLETCESTNTLAMECTEVLKHGDVVFTRHQTAGRGQQDRIWYAPPGVLTASFVLDILSGVRLSGLSLAAGLAAIYAVEDLLPNLKGTLRLKWPNDVWLEGRKLAGILCEAVAGNKGSSRVIVGIGLNRRADFHHAESAELGSSPIALTVSRAISLHQVSDRVPDELALLEQLRHYLLQACAMFSRRDRGAEFSGLTDLLPELRRRDALLGRQIVLELPGSQIAGEASGIDASGHLLLKLPSSDRLQAFASGRVVRY